MRTKIIATYGPASQKNISKIIKTGASIIRINTKYQTTPQIQKIIQKISGAKIMIDIKKRSTLSEIKNLKFDYLAISFAESPLEIKQIKKLFRNKKIISKIETKKGITNIEGIIKESDGIMIARGDLGENIPFQKVPMVQKFITKKCNKAKIFSITATEMMPSMVTYTRPSRAETSDIANAILEGSDALLLAEETAIGSHPVLAVKTMKKIIIETEKHIKKLL
jgi:pyruvate kinase